MDKIITNQPALPRLAAGTIRRLPTTITRLLRRWTFIGLCVRVAVWLVAFYLLDQFMMAATRLPLESYAQPSMALGIIQRLGPAVGVLLLIMVAVLVRFGLLLAPWSALEHGRQLRIFIVFLAVIVAWPLTTYGFNYYSNQGYYLDRLFIVALLPLLWLRPVFLFPFLLLCFATLWQFATPALDGGAHIPHKLHLLHVLNLFGAMFLWHAVTGERRSEGFFFMTCCLIGAVYWQPAMTKLSIGWLGHGELYHMPLAAYAHGWLSFVDQQVVIKFSSFLRHFDFPMQVFVIVVEAACLLILWRRRVALTLLVCLSAFHLAVFAFYGYLFWTWIALNVAVFVILYRDRQRNEIQIFSTGHLLLSAVLILLAPHWSKPPTLGWYDTRLSYTFRYDVIGDSGTTYAMPLRFFAPYGDVFTMANFSYLSPEHPFLVAPYGITGNTHRAAALRSADTAASVFELERAIGAPRYRPANAAIFYAFIERYVRNRNRGDREPRFMRYLRSPAQFWSFARGNPYTGAEPVREIVVKEVTTLFDDQNLIEIRQIELQRITFAQQ